MVQELKHVSELGVQQSFREEQTCSNTHDKKVTKQGQTKNTFRVPKRFKNKFKYKKKTSVVTLGFNDYKESQVNKTMTQHGFSFKDCFF